MSTCADVGSFIESKTSVVQISNVDFTSEVSDYLVVHTGPEASDRSFKVAALQAYSMLTPGQPAQALTLQYQTPDKVATTVQE